MSQWGIYFHEDGDCHIAPALPEGRFPLRHSLHEFCPCGPRSQEVYGRIIWVHQDDELQPTEPR
jgi:hypothetical protein